MFGPQYLKFDTDVMKSTANIMQDKADELRQIAKDLQDDLVTLQNSWNTTAGKKFFEEYDTGWATDVQKFISTIETTKALLGEAVSLYSSVEEQAQRMSF